MGEVDRLIWELRSREQWGSGRVEATEYGVPNIERLTRLDAHAAVIRSYSLLCVPGLLQCPEYALATLRAANPHVAEAELRRRVLLRSARSQAFMDLMRTESLVGLFVIGQQAIMHAANADGGVDVHARQLEHLLHVVDTYQEVTVLILPFQKVPARWASHLFMWAFRDEGSGETAHKATPACAYMEHPAGATYSTRVDDLARTRSVWADLVTASMGPAESRNYIAEVLGV